MSTRSERSQQIEYLENQFKTAIGIYLTGFNAINVKKMSVLRKDLRENNARYIVVKNSLAKIAFEKVGIKNLGEHITGPVGIALSDVDSMSPAKVIQKFNKTYKDILQLKVAYVDQNFFNSEEVQKLADLPSREGLLSQLLSCLSAPMSNFVGSLNGILTKLTGTLEAVKEKKQSEE
jgi:large subunit ribosomal protein L10